MPARLMSGAGWWREQRHVFGEGSCCSDAALAQATDEGLIPDPQKAKARQVGH